MEFDILVKNALVADGAGNPLFKSDIGICGGKIAAMGKFTCKAANEIDAAGLVAAPGFIDAHNHSDHGVLAYPDAQNFIAQGVTTSICGNCGLSLTPLRSEYRSEWAGSLAPFIASSAAYDWSWDTLGSFISCIESASPAQNMALLTGHGALRCAVMGFKNKEASKSEIELMKDLLKCEFEQGAVGLSFGLYYPPGSYADESELLALMEVAAKYGRRCAFHLLSESTLLIRSLNFVLELAHKSGAAVEISHHKAIGRENWGKVYETLRAMKRARLNGVDVLCDVYPYIGGSTAVVALLPNWTSQGSGLRERLKSRDDRERITKEILSDELIGDNLLLLQGWDEIMIAECPLDRKSEGRTLSDILGVHAMDKESIETFMDWLLSVDGRALMVLTNEQSEDDLLQLLADPLISLASDAWIVPYKTGSPHPRAYGTFPRFLGRYARDLKIVGIEEAVRKMTSASAQRYGLAGRGVVCAGMSADLVIFDLDGIRDESEYLAPHRYPSGIHHVIVNGRFALKDGILTGERAGMLLRAQ